MATRKKKKKTTVRKQSSPRLSTIAGRYQRMIARIIKKYPLGTEVVVSVDAKDLAALCGSVLSQDETKGQKRK